MFKTRNRELTLQLTSTWTRDERPELVLEIYEEEESRVLVGPVTVNHNDNSTQASFPPDDFVFFYFR